jgi:predicted glycosyltransferase
VKNEKSSPKRILFCSLNWGLGHASRDIPLIHKLTGRGYEVIIATDGQALEMLKGEFPDLETIRFRSYVNITYSRFLPAWLKIFLLSPLLVFEILTEHFRLKKIIREKGADLIISDNRYGLLHSRIPSILITHQLNPRLPRFLKFMELPVAGIFRVMIKQFNLCWVPDFPGDDNLSGDLSHKYTLPQNIVFIGPLSRFMQANNTPASILTDLDSNLPKPELLILISGPEPQRSKLENIFLSQISGLNLQTLILRGLPGETTSRNSGPDCTICNHLPSDQIKGLIEDARFIICRGGYTGIMDLVTLGKPALIIPTPGQTEQEYLAGYLSQKGILISMDQKNLNLSQAIKQLKKFQAKMLPSDNNLLEKELDRWF